MKIEVTTQLQRQFLPVIFGYLMHETIIRKDNSFRMYAKFSENFTCSKSTIETLEKDVKYVQS